MTATNDAPAPAPSGSGVREAEVKRIRDWLLERNREHLSASADNRLMMRREHGDAEMFLDAAILLTSLASDASPRGEAVAWRYRIGAQNLWSYCDTESDADFYIKQSSGREVTKQALYAHLAPATVEISHARCNVPGWEYETTTGPRKAWGDADTPPAGEGWVRNVEEGRNGWERFEYHEESYWRRPAALAPATEGRKG